MPHEAIQAITGLLTEELRYSGTSEEDNPVEPVHWTGNQVGEQKDLVNAVAAKHPGEKIEVAPLGSFFDEVCQQQDWFKPTEKATADRFSRLRDAVVQHLKDPAVLRVGSAPRKAVYVLGRTNEGTIAGVRTVVVET